MILLESVLRNRAYPLHRSGPNGERVRSGAMFGRGKKAPDPSLGAFLAAAEALDRAQRALLTAVPTSRNPGASLAEALGVFGRGLAEAERLMPPWRTDATEAWWQRCEAALRAASDEAARLSDNPPGPTDFEALNARIGDVLDPLEDFADAERVLRGRR
jgi:hypothetical protein